FMPKGYVEGREEITADYAEGETIDVRMHDGSIVRLKKLDRGHDPRNRRAAIEILEQAQREQLFLTGLIYYEEPRPTLNETLHLTDTPLVHLRDEQLRPSSEVLTELMQSFM
ncbi:MAG: hypothetical protein NZM00_03255, partial [Anaerolinea sp.]|nr:hypothetical protein [Anaerolinea sp.]